MTKQFGTLWLGMFLILWCGANTALAQYESVESTHDWTLRTAGQIYGLIEYRTTSSNQTFTQIYFGKVVHVTSRPCWQIACAGGGLVAVLVALTCIAGSLWLRPGRRGSLTAE